MAGDWIKIERSIMTKPEVFQLSKIVGQNRHEIVGRLIEFWSWIDQHTSDGRSLTLMESDVDILTSCTGFAAALRSVGWLDGRDGCLNIPNFERHLGSSAKARALESEAKKLRRMSDNMSDICPTKNNQNVGPEKRREEKSKNSTDSKPSVPPSRRIKLADEEFINELRKTYLGVNLDGEIQKMRAWLLTPKGRGRQLTRQFMVNWLNKCDAPLSGDSSSNKVIYNDI